MDFCRAGLTYEESRLSAMLADVLLDVGNLGLQMKSTPILEKVACFHTWQRSEVESFESIPDAVDA